MKSTNQIHMARLLSSEAWLTVTPLPSLGMHLDDLSIQVGVAQTFGSPGCEPHLCCCGVHYDSLAGTARAASLVTLSSMTQ